MGLQQILGVNGNLKHAAITMTSSADVVAAVSAKNIRVVAFVIVCSAAVTVKWQSGASSDLTGVMSFAANAVVSPPFNPLGHFQTVAGEKLNIVQSGAGTIAGHLTYVEID